MIDIHGEESLLDDDPTDELPVLTEAAMVQMAAAEQQVGVAPEDDFVDDPLMATAVFDFADDPLTTTAVFDFADDPLTTTAVFEAHAERVPSEPPPVRDLEDVPAPPDPNGRHGPYPAPEPASPHQPIDPEAASPRGPTDPDAMQATALPPQWQAEIEGRDQRIEGLVAELESTRRRVAELEEALAAAHVAATPESAAQGTPVSVPTEPAASAGDAGRTMSKAEQRRQQEDIEALAQYIELRRRRWEEAEALLAAREIEIRELEQELVQRRQREWAAEQRAREAVKDAARMRMQLIEVTTALRERQQQDALSRLRWASRSPAQQVERTSPERSKAKLDGLRASTLSPVTTDPSDSSPSGTGEPPALVSLEPEARPPQKLRTENDVLRQELSDRDARLRELRSRCETLEAELEESRQGSRALLDEVHRLERLLHERDRLLDHDAQRLAALERGLAEKSETLRRMTWEHIARDDEPLDGVDLLGDNEADTPMLICVTSERPRRYRLTKGVMTIGRSGHCEIQILTHFTSREHARLYVDQHGVVIEDMGSKNGVFVNAVRVERQQLKHSDLVTVGETQFRFVAGTTH